MPPGHPPVPLTGGGRNGTDPRVLGFPNSYEVIRDDGVRLVIRGDTRVAFVQAKLLLWCHVFDGQSVTTLR